MNILLYNPDNGVTRNFMPHLWMFLLQSLTPAGHKVHLIDGNARPMKEEELQSFVRENDIRLVGIGAMTRMAARAYQMADAARAAGALVVMGGPHVNEVPDEPLGRNGSPRHVDAIAAFVLQIWVTHLKSQVARMRAIVIQLLQGRGPVRMTVICDERTVRPKRDVKTCRA